MYNDSKLKIVVVSNIPSSKALKSFQKKLYEIKQDVEINKSACPSYTEQIAKPQ